MARYEYKYYIPLQYLDDLRRDIMPYLNYDHYSDIRARKEYTIRSIYLDSPQMHTYHEKLDGVRERRKYRVRGYNDEESGSIVFLEIKRKDDDRVSKDRAELPCDRIGKFLATGDYAQLAGSPLGVDQRQISAQNFLYYYHLYQLRPSALVTYEREAFECKFGSGLRITLDKYVRAKRTDSFRELFSEDGLVPALQTCFILEVKFYRSVPSWMPRVMHKYNILRDAASKYTMSIDATVRNDCLQYIL